MNSRRKLFIAITLSLAAATASAAPTIDEGLWEITSRMEMVGMPEMARRPMTFTHCYTKKDVEDARNLAQDKNSACKMTNYRLSGNKASWEIQCAGERPMTGKGEMTFSRNSYQGVTKLSGNIGARGEPAEMTQHISAKRLGECKGEQATTLPQPSVAKPATKRETERRRSAEKQDAASKAEDTESPAKDDSASGDQSDAVLDGARKLKGLLGF